MVKYDDEIELAPGIYLTKAQIPTETSLDNLNYLKLQIKQTINTLNQLKYSNNEMMNADPNDPIYIDSINENKYFIEKKEKILVDLTNAMEKVSRDLNIK
jgi:hypothetical protein